MVTSKDLPPALKSMGPFLDRATEFQARDPVIAFYCKRYALELAMKDQGKTKDKAILGVILAVMDEVEKEKAELGAREELSDANVGQAYVENFAMRLFTHADNQDRAGKCDKATAKLFLASSFLMDAMQTFGDIPAEIDEKRKYAKYKAVYITKCIKDGAAPIPGPPQGEGGMGSLDDLPPPPPTEDSAPPPSSHMDSFGLPPPPAAPTAPQFPTQQAPPPVQPSAPMGGYGQGYNPMQQQQYQPQYGASPSMQRQPVQQQPIRLGGGAGRTPKNMENVSDEDVKRVNKLCRFVMSSLQYDDIPTAVKNLQEAIDLLTY
eukprot:comp18813_c0_seq1/m.20776 comp18813_c0_seq1/g.20776  ORF comp18813_c0_seq1/g.20776 comp18813_c0_seq1/m.20776 type:complete len:319 (-) comp18813_c0_seq1:550-1506(-)